jgi:hypothetical protein
VNLFNISKSAQYRAHRSGGQEFIPVVTSSEARFQPAIPYLPVANQEIKVAVVHAVDDNL